MDQRDFLWFIIIITIIGAGIWMVRNEEYPIRQGLDLQGGLQVLMEADLPPEEEVTREQMDTARRIIEQRVNALGVAEPLVQTEGDRRILVELPGVDNVEDALVLIQETALLEFVDTGSQSLPEGTCVRTSNNTGPSRCELPPGAPITTTVANPPPLMMSSLPGQNYSAPKANQTVLLGTTSALPYDQMRPISLPIIPVSIKEISSPLFSINRSSPALALAPSSKAKAPSPATLP